MIKLFLLILLLLPVSLSAQIQWGHRLSSSGQDNIEGHIVDSAGNIVAVGYFEGNIMLEDQNLVSIGAGDIVIYKTTSTGQILWAKTLNNPDYAGDVGIATDKNGNIYVAGGFIGSLAVDGNTIISGNSRWNTFLGKFNTNGDLLWIKGIIGTNSISGSRVFGVVSANEKGEVVIAANFSGTVNLDNNILISGNMSQNNLVIAKFSTTGNLDWYHIPDAGSNVEAKDIYLDPDANVYLTGFYTTTLTLGQPQLEVTTTGYADIFLAKIDSTGTPLWSKGFNKSQWAELNNMGRALVVNPVTKEIYLTGSFKGSINIDGTILQDENTPGDPVNTDIFIVKLSANGSVIWAQRYGSIGHDFTMAIIMNRAGGVVIAGAWNGNPALLYVDELANLGSYLFVGLGGWITSITQITNDEFYVSGEFPGFIIGENIYWQTAGQSDGFLLRVLVSCQNNYNLPEKPSLFYNCTEISVTNYNGLDLIKWYKDGLEMAPQPDISLPLPDDGTYTVSIQNMCGVTTSDTLLYVKASMLPTAPVITFNCQQLAVQNINQYQISWYKDNQLIDSATAAVLKSPVNGSYKAGFQNDCGIVFSNTINFVLEDFYPPTPEIVVSETACKTITIKNQNDYKVTWLKNGSVIPYQTNIHLNILSTAGAFTVKFENDCGTSEKSVIVEPSVAEDYEFYNVITPNQDNKNDYFVIDPGLQNASLQVYNRWGVKVYNNQNYKSTWNGDGLPAGVYYWELTSPCLERFSGTLSIIY
jgi:gliding motility-associated-like protein